MAKHDIAYLQVWLERAARPDPDQCLDLVLDHQFVYIDGQGRHAHAAAHDRDPLIAIATGVAQHAADLVEANYIFQIAFRRSIWPAVDRRAKERWARFALAPRQYGYSFAAYLLKIAVSFERLAISFFIHCR